jgi:hypothetical protein
MFHAPPAGLLGLFFTLFCFIGIVMLIPLWIWTFIDGMMMFAGAITDSYGRKLQLVQRWGASVTPST